MANSDRQERRRAATRREILDAAWQVVRDDGWDGLTLRRVAEHVGMRAPSLYSHFESKLAIVDAMFGEAWAEYDQLTGQLEPALPDDPREALELVMRVFVEYMTADPARHALMNQRPVPGFTPSEPSYAPAVRTLDRLNRVLGRLGVDDPDAADLFTALTAGLAGQQIANDPGGERWLRLVPRASRMYADEVGVPRTPPKSPPRTTDPDTSERNPR